MPIVASVRMIRTAISPRFAMRILLNWTGCSTVDDPLHPEDAVAGVVERRVRRGGQGQAQHAASVDGVDDAVVPEPGGRVVGAALGFVLLADRGLGAFSPARLAPA